MWRTELLHKDKLLGPSTHPSGQFSKMVQQKQVDFRIPSVSDICNFLGYLFNVKLRHPSTIKGYRTAILDTLGNSFLEISNNPEISFWIKQTIKFCYSKVDNADMDRLGVKAHDLRAFATSKAFYGGISTDQIMQVCHWKSLLPNQVFSNS